MKDPWFNAWGNEEVNEWVECVLLEMIRAYVLSIELSTA